MDMINHQDVNAVRDRLNEAKYVNEAAEGFLKAFASALSDSGYSGFGVSIEGVEKDRLAVQSPYGEVIAQLDHVLRDGEITGRLRFYLSEKSIGDEPVILQFWSIEIDRQRHVFESDKSDAKWNFSSPLQGDDVIYSLAVLMFHKLHNALSQRVS
ncbi:hypothetical protein [Burkholderia ambifaria]|uniref:hypothetical protein n=1 Tax=Burkholderia ambifaria TaxID=152480 RepID=UPI0015887113|nr:hypothetical protein [Burkholderia ambifaria]